MSTRDYAKHPCTQVVRSQGFAVGHIHRYPSKALAQSRSNNTFIGLSIRIDSYNRSSEADLTPIPLLRTSAVLFLRIQNQKEELRSQGIPQE